MKSKSFFITPTGGFHERSVKLKRHERLFELPQEVFEESTDSMNLYYSVQHQRGFPRHVLLPQLLHLPLSSRHSVNTPLHTPDRHDTRDSSCIPCAPSNVLQYDRKDVFLKSKLSLIIQLCMSSSVIILSAEKHPCVGVLWSKTPLQVLFSRFHEHTEQSERGSLDVCRGQSSPKSPRRAKQTEL